MNGIEHDEALFACAIDGFDTLRLCPHWPGYPVAVVAARVVAAVAGVPGIEAWRLLGVVSTTAVAIAIAGAARRPLALLLVPALVGAVLWGSLAFSDPLAVLLGVAAVAALTRSDDGRWRIAAAVLMALAVGARPSGVVLLPALLMMRRPRRDVVVMLASFTAVSAVVWGLAVLVDDGFVDAGRLHLSSHFRAHGGAITSDVAWWTRPFVAARTLWVHLVGGWWPGLSPWRLVASIVWPLLLWRGVIVWRQQPPRWARPATVVVAAHVGFVLVVHDVQLARYFFPLFPLLAAIGAAGLPSRGIARVVVAAGLAVSAAFAGHLHQVRAQEGSLEHALLSTLSDATTIVTANNTLLLRAAVADRPELDILLTTTTQRQTAAIVESANRNAVGLTFDDEALAPPFVVVAEESRSREHASRGPFRARLWRQEKQARQRSKASGHHIVR